MRGKRNEIDKIRIEFKKPSQMDESNRHRPEEPHQNSPQDILERRDMWKKMVKTWEY